MARRLICCPSRFTPTGVGTIKKLNNRYYDRPVHPHGRGDNRHFFSDTWKPITVHPHGRGDNGPLAEADSVAGGSPPRAWGQWTEERPPDTRIRFTPTGVGTIRARSRLQASAPVHPHGRGDNVGLGGLGRRRRWFTPTGVGTMPAERRRGWLIAVHPHGRGDNEEMLYPYTRDYGSPPRAWGQYRAAVARPTSSRFTPTGVGTMISYRSGTTASAVHPHGRGDNVDGGKRVRIYRGSPPRAWGQW